MDEANEYAIKQWHAAVNSGDAERTVSVVTDPIVVLGPKGAGPISPQEFADWTLRSGIQLFLERLHLLNNRLLVAEQLATWPQSKTPIPVATLFRVSDGRVSAALRFPDLPSALDFASIYREMASTENDAGQNNVQPTDDSAGQTLFEFVRHWSGRSNRAIEGPISENGRRVLVIEAVHALSKRGVVTINEISREIGIDQSGASRLVKEAVALGRLTIKPSGADARQREVHVTQTGYQLLLHTHRWQQEMFEHLTDGWSKADRHQFHRSMLRLLRRSIETL